MRHVIETVKAAVKRKVLGMLWAPLRCAVEDAWEIRCWEKTGRSVPPPHTFKVRTVKAYAKRFSTPILVETGTYLGDMVFAVRHTFDQIYSLELDEDLYQKARVRFADFRHIHILQGDSAQALPRVLADINRPCLFWLDAHYSGGMTARGNIDTPIVAEVQHALACPAIESVILIDDARLFVGKNNYPTLDELGRLILSKRPTWIVEVRDDIIRIHQKTQSL